MRSFGQILKQAWNLTKTNRFLFWYGLLLFFGQIINFGYNWSSQANLSDKVPRLHLVALENFFNHPWVGWAVLVLVCLWLLIYFRASAGIILAIKSLIDKQPSQPLAPFYFGRFFVTRLLGLVIFLQLILFILGIIISSPVLYLFSIGLTNRAIILGILGLLVAVPFLLLIVFVNIIGPLFIVIYNLPFWAAIKASVNLIVSFWGRLLGFGIVLFGLTLLVLTLAGVSASPFVVLAVISYHKGGLLLSNGALFVLGSIVFLAVGTVLVSFKQAAWIIAFGELVKPQKTEQEEVEAAAETVSS